MSKLSRKYLLLVIIHFSPVVVAGQSFFGDPVDVPKSDANGPIAVFAADLDGDGDNDLLSASFWNRKLSWNENLDGQGSFSPDLVINQSDTLIRLTSSNNGMVFIHAADIDSDGDRDIVSLFGYESKLCWYENENGLGSFGPEQIIISEVSGAVAIEINDLDGDNDNDVLIASKLDNTVAWYSNINGEGSFGERKIISNTISGVESIHAADIDGDNDKDVLVAGGDDNYLWWYENVDGKGNFGSRHFISGGLQKPKSIHAADIDGDGDLDVVASSFWDNRIYWFENRDGKGFFGNSQVVTEQAEGASFAYAVDIDGDGDEDILSASQGDNKVAWYQNTNGKGSFGSQQVISGNIDKAQFAYGSDLNNDGKMDILASGCNVNKISWFENIPVQLEIGNEDTILIADENCLATIPDYTSKVKTPDCFQESLEILQSPPVGSSVNIGDKKNITLTINREDGNSVELIFNVWVIDKTAPVILSVPSEQRLDADDDCQVFIPDYTSTIIANDNCSYSSFLQITQVPEPWTSINGEQNEVIISVTDVANNTSLIKFSVSVIDQQEPSLVCMKEKSVWLKEDEEKYVVIGSELDPVLAYDNCKIVSLTNSFNERASLDGETLPPGESTVIWRAVDASGNAIQCASRIIVNEYTHSADLQESGLNVYPSITKGKVFIESYERLIYIKLIDITGKTVMIFKNEVSEKGYIDLSHFSCGIYFYVIATPDNVFSGKIIKTK